MRPTVTFIHSPDVRYDQNYGTLFVPLWAYTLSGYVPATWDKVVVDCVVSDVNSINESKIFAFSGINQDLESILEVLSSLQKRYPAAIYIIGGPITWSFQQENKLHLLNDFDHVFILDGEETLPQFLLDIESGRQQELERVITGRRFPISKSRKLNVYDFGDRLGDYYGGIIEVSRGCPFLCEFCDIRVLPGNNESHNKPVELIIGELDEYVSLGVTHFQFACDNFIGDLRWAEDCVDAILAWKEKTELNISIFTWLTINLYKQTELMRKMRLAGFSILFIGIESVNQNSLLETAKVQNRTVLETAVKTIQSFGFVIAPGFIFGFDSDRDSMFSDTLEFMSEAGIIGGDPSFLMALPGTPLYDRMKKADRLVDETERGTTREKISTNIKYIQDSDKLVQGFIEFVARYTSADYQLDRFRKHIEGITESSNYIASNDIGYGSPREYLRLQFKDPVSREFLVGRLTMIMTRPKMLLALIKGWVLSRRLTKRDHGAVIHFNYWVYAWTNISLKYKGLSPLDFSLTSVSDTYPRSIKSSEIDDENSEVQLSDRQKRKNRRQKELTNRALEDLNKAGADSIV